MTVDLVAEQGGLVLTNRADLYRRWTHQKLLRDFRKARPAPVGWENQDQLIAEIIGLMTDAALWMTEGSDSGHELLESVPETELRSLAVKRFGSQVPSAVYTTTSLLEPMSGRSAAELKLRFFHRSFHEYFLALALHRNRLDGSVYPEPVRAMLDELPVEP